MPEAPETGENSSERVFVRPSKPISEMSEEELDALVREIWRKTKT